MPVYPGARWFVRLLVPNPKAGLETVCGDTPGTQKFAIRGGLLRALEIYQHLTHVPG